LAVTGGNPAGLVGIGSILFIIGELGLRLLRKRSARA
jgi:hypothetical protein